MRLTQNILRICFILIVTICVTSGIIFRVGNLSQKMYWEDEVYTSIRISGYTQKMITQEIDGKITPILELNRYQDVKLGKNWLASIKAIASRPEQAPLYYIMARVWAEIFGSSVESMRALPVLFSLLSLPCFYWLSLELFKSPVIAATTISLASLSPILIRYSQEARPYSLWIVTTLLLHIIFLRSIRLQTKKSWLLYSSTVTLTMLTQLISCLVLIAHSIYIITLFWIIKKPEVFRLKISLNQAYPYSINWRQLNKYFQSLMIGLIPTIPWFVIIIIRWSSIQAVTSWQNSSSSLNHLVNLWAINLNHLLFSWQIEQELLRFSLSITILILISWASYQLINNNNRSKLTFLLTTIVLYSGIFVSKDLISGGISSTVDRYFLPVDIILLVMIGYVLGNQLINYKQTIIKTKLTMVLTMVILIVAWQSCFYNLQAKSWWGGKMPLMDMAAIISQSSQPLLISDVTIAKVLSLCNNLNDDAQLQLISQPSNLQKINISSITSNKTFLYNPSQRLITKISKLLTKSNYNLQLIYQNNHEELWKLSL